MLTKVVFVGIKNFLMDAGDLWEVFVGGPGENGLWHTADNEISSKLFLEASEKNGGDGGDSVDRVKEIYKGFLAIGKEEFGESHGVELEEIDLTDGE